MRVVKRAVHKMPTFMTIVCTLFWTLLLISGSESGAVRSKRQVSSSNGSIIVTNDVYWCDWVADNQCSVDSAGNCVRYSSRICGCAEGTEVCTGDMSPQNKSDICDLCTACTQIDPCTINYNGEVLGGDCCQPYECSMDGSQYHGMFIDCVEVFYLYYFDNCAVIKDPPQYGCCRQCVEWKKACTQIDPCTVNYNGEVLGGNCCQPYECSMDGSQYDVMIIDCVEFFDPYYFDNCTVIKDPPQYGCCRQCVEWKKDHTCLDSAGVEWPVGPVPSNNPCVVNCFCSSDETMVICAVMGCIHPPCSNPVQIPGQCCPVCSQCTSCGSDCSKKNWTQINYERLTSDWNVKLVGDTYNQDATNALKKSGTKVFLDDRTPLVLTFKSYICVRLVRFDVSCAASAEVRLMDVSSGKEVVQASGPIAGGPGWTTITQPIGPCCVNRIKIRVWPSNDPNCKPQALAAIRHVGVEYCADGCTPAP